MLEFWGFVGSKLQRTNFGLMMVGRNLPRSEQSLWARVDLATRLVVTMDTECDNQWELDKRTHITLENIRQIPKLQSLFGRYRVRPTYLVTYPVSTDPTSVAILNDLLRDGHCEIGAHLHAWTTPPRRGNEARDHVYLHNLPRHIQREKFIALHSAIEEHFGIKPVSYRGGRWSLDGYSLRLLEEFGYLVDTSVTPYTYWRDGGPDFRRARPFPYFPAFDDVCRPGQSRILEVPVSIAFTRRNYALKWAYLYFPPRLHAGGILRRLRLLNLVWLEPSLSSYREMETLCRFLLDSRAAVLNLMLHSSELMVNGSPYHRTSEDLKRFYEKLEVILNYLVKERGVESRTLAEFAREWRAPLGGALADGA